MRRGSARARARARWRTQGRARKRKRTRALRAGRGDVGRVGGRVDGCRPNTRAGARRTRQSAWSSGRAPTGSSQRAGFRRTNCVTPHVGAHAHTRFSAGPRAPRARARGHARASARAPADACALGRGGMARWIGVGQSREQARDVQGGNRRHPAELRWDRANELVVVQGPAARRVSEHAHTRLSAGPRAPRARARRDARMSARAPAGACALGGVCGEWMGDGLAVGRTHGQARDVHRGSRPHPAELRRDRATERVLVQYTAARHA